MSYIHDQFLHQLELLWCDCFKYQNVQKRKFKKKLKNVHTPHFAPESSFAVLFAVLRIEPDVCHPGNALATARIHI